MIEEEFQKEVNPEYLPVTPKKNKIKIPIGPIFGFLLVLLIIFSVFLIYNKHVSGPDLPTASVIPDAIFTPRPAEINISSPLATDSSVLKIKKEIDDNYNSANSIDLSESNLSFPIIDFNIGF